MNVHDRPTADELLAIARETVLRELLPQLPPGAHYAARMVANAIAIARREQQAPALPASLAAELERLAGGDADRRRILARAPHAAHPGRRIRRRSGARARAA